MSRLVKDNLKSPLLALLQPRASLRAKQKDTVEIAYSRQLKVDALEEVSVERNTIQRIIENPTGKVRVRDRPVLDGIPWKEGPRQENVFQGKPANMLRFLESVIVQKKKKCL